MNSIASVILILLFASIVGSTSLAEEPLPKDTSQRLLVIELGLVKQATKKFVKQESQARKDFEAAVRTSDIKSLNEAMHRQTVAKNERIWHEFRAKEIREVAKRIGVTLPKQVVDPTPAERESNIKWLKLTAKQLPGDEIDKKQIEWLQKSLGMKPGDEKLPHPLRVNSDELTHANRPGISLGGIKPRRNPDAKMLTSLEDLCKRLGREIEAIEGNDENAKQLIDSAFDGARTFKDQELTGQLKVLQRRLEEFRRRGKVSRAEFEAFNAEGRELCKKLNIPFIPTVNVEVAD